MLTILCALVVFVADLFSRKVGLKPRIFFSVID